MRLVRSVDIQIVGSCDSSQIRIMSMYSKIDLNTVQNALAVDELDFLHAYFPTVLMRLQRVRRCTAVGILHVPAVLQHRKPRVDRTHSGLFIE